MGMYTTTDYCDLKMRDNTKDNRKELEDIVSEECMDNWNMTTEGDVDFYVDWKMYGYWYEDTLTLLEKLNKYIKGTWYLSYEEGDKVVIIFPEDETKEVEIELGVIRWDKPRTLTQFTKDLRGE